MDIVILGLSITSSWGNGHATTYRSLVRELDGRDHDVLFLERDVPWYAEHRDLPEPPWGRTALYDGVDDLLGEHGGALSAADLVVVGSYVPDGVEVARRVLERATGVTAFYDIDTPVTLERLEDGTCDYLVRDLVPEFDLYLSFAGGPTLETLEEEYGARRARHLPCSVDTEHYYPEETPERWDLGYLGTHSEDRQRALEALLLEPARTWSDGRFVVAGPGHPDRGEWPATVESIDHLPPARHRAFYNAQRWTLNLTRAAMIRRGWSPSVRLFEAAACGTPVVSDRWPGLADYFEPGREIVVADSTSDVLGCLRDVPPDERARIGERARRRVLEEHTASHRAASLETFARELAGRREPA